MGHNRAEIARHCGLSRARVTQIMSLLHLPDEIQEYVMALPVEEQRLYSGRRLRKTMELAHESAQLAARDELRRTVRESQFPQ